MAVNRYIGNTGRVIRVEQQPRAGQRARPVPPPPPPPPTRVPARKAPEPLGGLGKLLGGLGGKLKGLQGLETEDLLLFLVLYLMYRDSGDTEPLIILAAMLFL